MLVSYRPLAWWGTRLFAILVLRQFFKTDYRGSVVLLDEWAELRSTLGLKQIPNFSTLCVTSSKDR